MSSKLYLLISIMAITILLALPAVAQEDRSSDTSFGFAGRAEYNKPVAGETTTDVGAASVEELPDTGGSWLIMPATGGALLLGGVLLARRAVRQSCNDA